MANASPTRAVQYYGSALDSSKVCFVVDWFEITTIQSSSFDLEPKQEFEFKAAERGNRFFQSQADIYYRGLKVAHIQYMPHENSVLAQGTSIIKFENELLYSFDSLKIILERFFKLYPFRFSNVTRLDLAVDFDTKNKSILTDFYKAYLNEEVKPKGNRLVLEPYHKDADNFARVSGISYGGTIRKADKKGVKTRGSSRHLRIYDKSLQLETVNKPYVLDYWKKNGLNPERVYRVELELRHKFLSKREQINPDTGECLSKFTLNDYLNIDKLKSLYLYAYDQMFTIITDTKKCRTDREKVVSWLPVHKIKSTITEFIELVCEKARALRNSTRSALITVRTILKRYVEQKQMTFIGDAVHISQEAGIYDYVRERLEKYLAEFQGKANCSYQFEESKFFDEWAFHSNYIHSYGKFYKAA